MCIYAGYVSSTYPKYKTNEYMMHNCLGRWNHKFNSFVSEFECLSVSKVLVSGFLVDGPGMSFVGGITCPQAPQTCCDSLLWR